MSMGHLEEEKLHRYFDGELGDAEAEEVRRALESSEEDRARLVRLERLRTLIAVAAEESAADIASEDLFAKVSSGVESNKSRGYGQPFRVLEEENRPTRVEAWKLATAAGLGLAVAAAVLLFVVTEGPEAPVVRPETPEAEVEIAETAVTTIEGPQGSEVEEVDFGSNIGTVFEVQGEGGEPIAIVWINDEPAEQIR